MQHFIVDIIGFPTVPAIDRNILPGSILTLNDEPSSESVWDVFFKYFLLAEISAIRTHAHSPSVSKYFGSSIGLGDAPLLTIEIRFIRFTSHDTGIFPIHSTPLRLYSEHLFTNCLHRQLSYLIIEKFQILSDLFKWSQRSKFIEVLGEVYLVTNFIFRPVHP